MFDEASKRPALATVLVYVATSHHAVGVIHFLETRYHGIPTRVIISSPGDTRSKPAVQRVNEAISNMPNACVVDEFVMSLRGLPQRGTFGRVRRLTAGTAMDFITAYPYQPGSLLVSRLLGARRLVAVDDGGSILEFAGLDRELARRVDGVVIPPPTSSQRAGLKLMKPRWMLSRARKIVLDAAAKAVLPLFHPLFISDYPLRKHLSWTVRRLPPLEMPCDAVGDWILVVGAPLEGLGTEMAEHARLGMIRDAVARFPDAQVVYLLHPNEKYEWFALNQGSLPANVEVRKSMNDWRDLVRDFGALPRASYSMGSTLAYQLSRSSSAQVETHLSLVQLHVGTRKRWRAAVAPFVSVCLENHAQVELRSSDFTFYIRPM